MSAIGLRATTPWAQALEPQHDRIALIASSVERRFHRARVSDTSLRLKAICSEHRRFKNSTTRLPATAARYLAVDRMSSIGCTSEVAVSLAECDKSESIDRPRNT